MLHRLSRMLRQPFAIMAVLFLLLGTVMPAAAAPSSTADSTSVAQDGDGTAVISVTAFTCAPDSQPTAAVLPRHRYVHHLSRSRAWSGLPRPAERHRHDAHL